LPAALGELERRRGNAAAATQHFERALALARSAGERRFLERQIRAHG
jgi:predicted RNA polymerase sigma factor